MSEKKATIDQLGQIIRTLADVWPNDRDGVTVAGANFEEAISELDTDGVQLKKLIDLAWEGMKYLYEKDEYFMSVKTTTMQAVNTVREYLISEGEIPVEDFERSQNDLEKALQGGKESADEVLEIDEPNEETGNEKSVDSVKEEEAGSQVITLNDVASYLLALDHDASFEELYKLAGILDSFYSNCPKNIRPFLVEAAEILESVLTNPDNRNEDWLSVFSEKIEKAIEVEADSNWDKSGEDNESNEPPASEINKGVPEETEVFIISDDMEVEMVGEFITECADLIQTAEVALLDLEERPNDQELVNTVFRAFHTIKGTSAFMGLDPISKYTHSAETLLDMVRSGDLAFDRACADINLDSIDILKKLLSDIESVKPGDPLHTPAGYDRMMRVFDLICEDGVEPAKALEQEGTRDVATDLKNVPSESGSDDETVERKNTENKRSVTAPAEPSKQDQKAETEATVRVNVGRLDRLIDMVGELVIAHSVVAQDRTIGKDSELLKKINHTTKILRELQDSSLTLRMVPLRSTFHKMNRLVRDLTRKAGKSVKFTTIGDDTEIDRNMVDIINEPLVHMLRNAIDHGIESPEERSAAGKDEVANVWLRAYQEGGKVVIEIEDDGKGIDQEKVLQKAIDKGLVEPDKKMTDSEIFGLIFLPGFSSVDQVTDLSGRGVGMDVVRRSIEELQGKVEVMSEKGKGTKVSLELPFTLAITDGMLVKIGEQRFIIPTINIDMTFQAKDSDLFTIMGESEQVNFRGSSIPVIRLHKLFNVDGATEDLVNGTMLVIKNNNKKYALLVDEIIGQQQLVGKSIKMMVKTPHISGGAILGDGRVGLILDTAAVAAA